MPSFIVVPLSIVVLLSIAVPCFILEQFILDKKLDFDNILWYHQLRPDLRRDLPLRSKNFYNLIKYFHVQHYAKDHDIDCLDIVLLRCNGSTPID